MPYMYIVECRDGTYYTGSTKLDPEARVWEHNHDEAFAARFTIKRRPVVLVYAEQFDRIDDAFAREKQVQKWSRAKKRALIDERWDDLPALARGRRASDASTGSATGSGSSDASTGSATGVRDGDASTGSATDASTSSATGSGCSDASTGSGTASDLRMRRRGR